MIRTPATSIAVQTLARLELRIADRLQADPEALALFEAHCALYDSLAGGVSGEPLTVSYDDLVATDVAGARTLLAQGDTQ